MSSEKQKDSAVELALRRRHTRRVLGAVFVPEKPKVDGAAFDFIEVHRIGPAVGRRQTLEEEHIEESAQ